MGDRAALFRAVAERIEFGEGELSDSAADGFQFPLGERAVDLSVLQATRLDDNACGVECDGADQFICDVDGIGAGSARAGEWHSEEVSEVRRVYGPDAVRQLFHDYDLSDAVSLAGIQLDVGQVDSDCAFCGAGVAVVAFWIKAAEEVTELAGVARKLWQIVGKCRDAN